MKRKGIAAATAMGLGVGLVSALSTAAVSLYSPPVQATEQCTVTYTLYDYYDNGVYVFSAWEATGYNCEDVGGNWNGDDPGGGLLGGAGGGTKEACYPNDEASIDEHADGYAALAAKAIAAQSNSSSREYGALIYRNSTGGISITNLVPGTATVVEYDLSDLGVNGGAVIGIVHNHPPDEYDGSLSELNVNNVPSDNDWAAADWFINTYNANSDLMTLYIVGTDGVLREYDYNNKAYHQPERTSSGMTAEPGEEVPPNQFPPSC